MVTTWARRHILAEIRNAETAFALRVAAFFVNDFRVDEDEFGAGILFESDVDHGDAAGDADLRRSQAHSAGSIHRLEHVLDQLLQFFVEDCYFLGRLLEDGISEFHDGIDHFSRDQ